MAIDQRRYELPGIEDLTKEQEAVLALPSEGRHLIVGGPGTGKTTICLLRARRLSRRGGDYAFLVWNHLLHRASTALLDGELEAATWNSWFWKLFRQLTGRSVPLLEAQNGGWRPEDWKQVRRMITELPKDATPVRPLLVIDEGQDMPPGFYDALNELDFQHVFVAADQNQQIKEDENSSIAELRDSLVLDRDAIELTWNHRNSYPIARLAREFYTGDPASPPPELPRRRRALNTPRLYYVSEAQTPRIARSILKHWDQDPRRLVGVIAPNNAVREKYLRAIRARNDVKLDNGTPTVQTFHYGHQPEVHFDRGGVLVINAQACKGLEFDTVVLADIDGHTVDAADPDRVKKLFYVMVSRARRRVVMFMNKDGSPEIEELLPEDEGILCREDLTNGTRRKEEDE